MKSILTQRTEELKAILDTLPEACGASIAQAANLIIESYRNGGGVFIFGNGGSAADAQHIAGELNGRFLKERRPLKAQALVGDAATVTSIANDYGYEQIFAKQLLANAREGDVAFGLSTSGNSKNVIEAFKAAKTAGIKTIVLTGRKGGQSAKWADVLISIPSDFTPHIQEAGMLVYHCICEQVESDV
jgi:D-sedoheptulose 7-phosphate isomerase